MTAQELCTDMRVALLEQFGPEESRPPETFGRYLVPGKYFDYSVRSIDPASGQEQRNPHYCATDLGASVIKELLGADRIVMGNAMSFEGLGGSFSDTKLVPWVIFKKPNEDESSPVNCGVLLDYFNHSSNPATVMEAEQALEKAQFEVTGAWRKF